MRLHQIFVFSNEIPKKIAALRRCHVAEAIKGDVDFLLKGVGDQAVAKEVKQILEMVLFSTIISSPFFAIESVQSHFINGIVYRQDVQHQEEKFFTQIFSHHLLLRNQFQYWENLLMLR